MMKGYAMMPALAVGLSTEIHAATAATPIEPLSRDYREPWDCMKSSQASCESMETLCKALGAAWSKE